MTNSNSSGGGGGGGGGHGTIKMSAMTTPFMPVGDILAHKLTMFNYKLPSARTLHESSLIYCNLCDFSCDLTDKSAIICHYLSKHPDDNIVYSYLWPQMETVTTSGSSQYKIKYYLIKAHLKVRSKEGASTSSTLVTTTTDLATLAYPNMLLTSEEQQQQTTPNEGETCETNDSQFVMNKLLDWLDTNLTVTTTTTTTTSSTSGGGGGAESGSAGADVQELEEEQEVQEVEMSGEDVYDASNALQQAANGDTNATSANITELVKLTASALFHANQQKVLNNAPHCNMLDNTFLVHLLAINKIENVFRVKQIHDYYGGCFVCGQKVEFNMKHYQTHFNTEITAYMCLHCNHKEYRQEAEKQSGSSASSTSLATLGNSTPLGLKSPTHNHLSTESADSNDSHCLMCAEERLLQSHMSDVHQIDFAQIVAQHQQLMASGSTSAAGSANSGEGVVVIESPPMNDMYLQVTIKSLKYIDDELLRRDEFKTDLVYSCPICMGDVNVHVASTLGPHGNTFAHHESVTFEYLMAHFLHYHQFKAIPLFVCTLCNCARVSLIDCVYHFIRSHFNIKPVIGICAYNIYDKLGPATQVTPASTTSSSKKAAAAAAAASASTNHAANGGNACALANSAAMQSPVYGSGPLVHCAVCAENYSNEQAFIRHSFLAHLLDPNVNLNWFKVYTPPSVNQVTSSHTYEQSLQFIAQTMSDEPTTTDSSSGNNTSQQVLVYECPLCYKPVNSRDSIARHLIYHALSDQYEYDLQCLSCAGGKQLSPVQNLAECLLHVREFKGHRVQIGFHKYVLNGSGENGEKVMPMCACVLCGHEQHGVCSCLQHIMLDHFGYDSGTIRMKRFVNALTGTTGPLSITASSDSMTSSTVSPLSTTRIKLNSLKTNFSTPKPAPPTPSSTPKQDLSQCNSELVAYFGQQFPPLTNELVVSLMSAATQHSAATNSLNKIGLNNHHNQNSISNASQTRTPDTFFQDVRCFKCAKFATKLKQSLFRHLHDEHQFDLKELERLYEQHIQTQLQSIDEQLLVEKYERAQREVAQHQFAIFKETRLKNEQLKKEAQVVVALDQQTTMMQLSNDVSQQNNFTSMNLNSEELIVPVTQSQHSASNSTPTISVQTPATAATTTSSSTHSPQTVPGSKSNKPHHHNNQHTANHQPHHHHQPPTAAQIDKIDSTIDQVLSQICKDDYESPSKQQQQHHHHHQQQNHHQSHHNQQQQQQQGQITVTAQPPEAENLFVFKCNLCDGFSTDDATALLDHYKLTHSVELTIADSSTLLAAAVAAFQTGHTIEMTGAILNTLSSVTDESGLTIISGEEVPVHTTVQYKCTLCQAIFYEKQYIVQHLYEAHQFEIDVAYFEEIEQQQQEQLQQKIYEQQQEQQLMMQQQQQQQQQQGQIQQQQEVQVQHQMQHDAIMLDPEQQQVPAQVQVVAQQQRTDGSISDETAAVMMVMMNGGTLTATPLQPNQIITDPSGNGATAQLVITQSGDAQLVTSTGATTLLQPHHDIQSSLIPVNTTATTTTTTSATAKPAINYSCTYCTFGTDKLKKMSDHLKQSHSQREKTCMDNTRQQLIRLPNEDLPPYNQTPTTVGALLNLHQQQQLQQQQQLLQQKQQQMQQQQHQRQIPQQITHTSTNSSHNLMDNLSSSLINLTTSIAQNTHHTSDNTPTITSTITPIPSQQSQQQQQQSQTATTGKATPTRKRGPKAKTSPGSGGGARAQTVASTLSKQHQQQQQLMRTPTILTMDANSQIIIDFNQNDDLICSYCDYNMNNLNYMRTHIKYKHKSLPITFQNKCTGKYYTIVEWPLTAVPTLTPAPQQPPGPQPPPSQSQQNPPPSDASAGSQSQNQHQPQQQQQTSSTHSSSNTQQHNNQPASAAGVTDLIDSSSSTSSPAAPPTTPIQHMKSSASKENLSKNEPVDSKIGFTQAGGININTNNVNSILKKLGVNIGASSGGSSALTTLISGIGSGTKSVNNSIVNVSLNSFKDVNVDEMIDDDDDEERKFLIRELEKKASANAKKGGPVGLNTSTGYNSDTGSTGGVTPVASSTTTTTPAAGGIGGVRVKRSRSNSSTGGHTQLDSPNSTSATSAGDLVTAASSSSTATTATSTNAVTTIPSSAYHHQPTAQLNITLNCHYCWAQFQLNVTKNLKNSVQQKENGKYMQHLSLHLNAPYKCNECSYPITDTKTFFKHKQFYKHDEKTCIMVDNDLTIPNSVGGGAASALNSQQQGAVRRKTLIATRLRQYLQQKQHQQTKNNEVHDHTPITSNEIEFEHDRDSFKCLLCYAETDPAPCTSVSTLNKCPTGSQLGASNFSFDKEQVLKHVLIVHLSFLAYKCDTCVQFYAFDEPQTKQHAALVHQSGTSEVPCHFKLIKTEEEINLAINRAQQFIAKIGACATPSSRRNQQASSSSIASESSESSTTATKTRQPVSVASIDALPKYKCCKCNATTPQQQQQQNQQAQQSADASSTTTTTPQQPQTPIILYTYQEALDHVMSVHMSPQQQQQQQLRQQKTKQALNYELELFEQQMEDLISVETGVVTTVSASKAHADATGLLGDESGGEEEDDEEQGEWCKGYNHANVDLSEWSLALSEPVQILSGANNSLNPGGTSSNSPSQLSGHRRKRFKTNANTSLTNLTDPNSSSTDSQLRTLLPPSFHQLKKFFYQPLMLIKCQLCERRMSEFDANHWLQHDSESHRHLFKGNPTTGENAKFVYQQVRAQTPTTTASGTGESQGQNSQISNKTYDSFTEFWQAFSEQQQQSSLNKSESASKLLNCLICGFELKYLYSEILCHYAHEHSLPEVTSSFTLSQLECLHALQANNLCQLSMSANLRKHPYIRIPPLLVNPQCSEHTSITRTHLLDKEIKQLKEIYKEQIVEKQIVSWLNSEQFFRRWLNYNSFVCVICCTSKVSILDAHYSAKLKSDKQASIETPSRTQYYSEEMKTVVLTNHVLSHFNEYCYRCMSCKISWPDRTQLLKHAQECSNSQVVRTKTKYKLKANCRLQLKFYLHSLIDYWTQEKDKIKNDEANVQLLPSNGGLKCFIIDIFKNKRLFLETMGKNEVNEVCTSNSVIKLTDADDTATNEISTTLPSDATKTATTTADATTTEEMAL